MDGLPCDVVSLLPSGRCPVIHECILRTTWIGATGTGLGSDMEKDSCRCLCDSRWIGAPSPSRDCRGTVLATALVSEVKVRCTSASDAVILLRLRRISHRLQWHTSRACIEFAFHCKTGTAGRRSFQELLHCSKKLAAPVGSHIAI